MKAILTTITVFLFCSCERNTTKTDGKKDTAQVCISVVRDRTDRHVLQPEIGSILSLFNLSEDKDASVRFRYREITDKMLEPIVNLALPSETISRKRNKEALFRERMILNFYDTIAGILKTVNTDSDTSWLGHSECFKTIADELTSLSITDAQNRLLLVFSNLFENAEILSVYRSKNGQLSVPDSKTISERFEKACLLPENLKGITVFFVFQPTTTDEDSQYLKMAGVYKRLLEARGAIVKVQASNNFSIN